METDVVIDTVALLIDRLGGPAEAGRILGGVSPQRVWNWGAAGKIPADLYLEHRQALIALRVIAADSLWFGDRTPPAAAGAEVSP